MREIPRERKQRAILRDKRGNLKRGFAPGPIYRRAYVRRCNPRLGALAGSSGGEAEGDNSTGMEGVGVTGGCAACGGGGGEVTCTSDRRILKVVQTWGRAGGYGERRIR